MIIPFEKEHREKFNSLLEQIFDTGFYSHGPMNEQFEGQFESFTGLSSATVSSGGAGLAALLAYVDVKNKDVIVPTNTFMATPLAVKLAGGDPVYADCKKEDLCIGVEQIKAVRTPNTKAVIVVHIGGHIAFDIEAIAMYCESEGLALIEDCAHAHGAQFNGRAAGSFGVGGAYSFYATKTMPMGEGGMVVSKDPKVTEFVQLYRNYGKKSIGNGRFEYPVEGFNFRMSEMMAAFGIVQMERLPKILQWKRELAKKYDEIFPAKNRIQLPHGMTSGYYKYIIFDTEVGEKTGGVFDELCHELAGQTGSFLNSQWVATHHVCPPMYYGWEHAGKSVEEIKDLLVCSV